MQKNIFSRSIRSAVIVVGVVFGLIAALLTLVAAAAGIVWVALTIAALIIVAIPIAGAAGAAFLAAEGVEHIENNWKDREVLILKNTEDADEITGV